MGDKEKSFEGISSLRLMQGRPRDGAWRPITREEAIIRYGVLYRQMLADVSMRATFIAFRSLCIMAFDLGFLAEAHASLEGASNER